ncbi:MAG: hypothetical protein C0485_18770 [Pirellula sp.]|nr:hypothetical protein [Pirellula sp.]
MFPKNADQATRRTAPHEPSRSRRSQFESLESRLALSVTILSEDFQDDAVGAQPNSADQFWNPVGPESFIQVSGAGGAYATPFGGGTNKALVIDDVGAAQPIVSWRSAFSDDPHDFQTGTIEFDLYLPAAGSRNWTFFDFRLGYGGAGRTAPTTVNDTTVWNSFRINPGAPQGFILDDSTGTFLASITPNSLLRLRYDLDGATQTYRLTVNGTLVTAGGNPNRPWRAGATGVNMMGFFGAYPANSALVYVDNITVTNDAASPEPWTPPSGEPTDLLQWYQHRGNKRLTGEATVAQDVLASPVVLWSEYIGSQSSLIAAAPADGADVVPIPTSAFAMSAAENASWGVGGPYFDLVGNGTLVAQSTSSIRRVGDFIPGNGMMEKIEGEVFDPTFGQGVIRLSVYQNGAWVQQWQSAQIPSMFGIPNLTVGDFDNDGVNEVAVVPWTSLYILNINTGALERTGVFKPAANESGRGYGWLGAYDLTGDARDEFVVIGDFQDYISVMGWNGSGNLVQLWTHVFDQRLAGKQTSHRPMAFPVRDVTGDGRPEIVTSIYNETGDQRWHLLVFDSANGAVLHNLIDHVIEGARDVNGDGDFELFVQTTDGALIPAASTVQILDWNGAGFAAIWSQPNAAFVRADLSDFPLNVNSAASTGKSDLLTGRLAAGQEETFFTRRLLDAQAATTEITAWQLTGTGGAAAIGAATGVNLSVAAVRQASPGQTSVLFSTDFLGTAGLAAGDYDGSGLVGGNDLLNWQRQLGLSVVAGSGADGNGNGVVDAGDLTIWRTNFGASAPNAVEMAGFIGNAVTSQKGSPPRSSVVVGRLDGPTSAPTVVVQGGSQSMVALQADADGSVDRMWSQPGIGGFTGATQFQGQHEYSGAALADVDGNGTLETLFAAEGAAGEARLIAAASDGTAVWTHDFDVPGGTRQWNQPGLTLWRTGHFRSTEYEDVLVQLMRGSGGTGEFQLLDGRTGALVWTRTYGNSAGSSPVLRNAGEAQMVVYDWDGDGLDEAVNVHPDMFYVVDGDGDNLIDRSIYNGGVFAGGSPLYGTPIVADFLNNQTDSILFAGGYSQLGLMTKSGVDVWHTPFIYDNTPGFIQGVGDVDGDGDLDLLSVGHPSSPGVDTQSRFHAYDAKTGALLWSVNLPGRAHAPVGGAYSDTPTLSISGDVDNDGRVESIFAINGTLYVVGANPGGTSGSIEWTFTPDSGYLGSPVLADANGDGLLEIVVVSTSGMIYGIGTPASAVAPLALQSAAVSAVVESDESIAAVQEPLGKLMKSSVNSLQLLAGRQLGEELAEADDSLTESDVDEVVLQRWSAMNDDPGTPANFIPSIFRSPFNRSRTIPDEAWEAWGSTAEGSQDEDLSVFGNGLEEAFGRS